MKMVAVASDLLTKRKPYCRMSSCPDKRIQFIDLGAQQQQIRDKVEERIRRVVEVKYNQAALIATAVGDFISEEVQRYERLGENVAVQRQLEQEVTVVAQEETNRLLLSVSPRYESQVMDMIRQLDQPPAMVTVEERFSHPSNGPGRCVSIGQGVAALGD